jgi:hypothetical protein
MMPAQAPHALLGLLQDFLGKVAEPANQRTG